MGENRLPNLIIAGVNKAATTSLFMYLSAHPNVCMSSKKETGYFLHLRYGLEMPPIEHYHRYFDHCTDQKYILEATGGYFYGGADVASAIQEVLNEPRIVIILRDPVLRLFSFYRFQKSMLYLDSELSFREYVATCENMPLSERSKKHNNQYWGIDGGFYSDYLEEWFNVFQEDEIRILFFEHLKSSPRSVLADLCEWLKIEHERYLASLHFSVENRTMAYRNEALQRMALTLNWEGEAFWRSHPWMKRVLRRIYYTINGRPHSETISDEMKAHLDSLFRPYNERLADQLLSHGYTGLPDWLSRYAKAESSAR
jgi:hypothetical protein